MAFDIFKKKKKDDNDDFPFEEKAEILGDDDNEEDFSPEYPAEQSQLPKTLPQPENIQPRQTEDRISQFGSGFRSPQELKPPEPSPMRSEPQETQIPPFKAPEPLPTPKPEPRGVEMRTEPRMQSEFGQVPRVKDKPHIFIKIDKYKDVMGKVKDLDQKIESTKKVLSKIEDKNEEEKETMKEAIDVLMKIEKLVSYLEDTFTSTEE